MTVGRKRIKDSSKLIKIHIAKNYLRFNLKNKGSSEETQKIHIGISFTPYRSDKESTLWTSFIKTAIINSKSISSTTSPRTSTKTKYKTQGGGNSVLSQTTNGRITGISMSKKKFRVIRSCSMKISTSTLKEKEPSK